MHRLIGILVIVATAWLMSSSQVARAQASYKGYPYGYCTYYAAIEYDKQAWYKVNWHGNAGDWARAAAQTGHWVDGYLYDGYYCGNGTVVVWSGGNDGLGHVAVLRSTTRDGIWVDEMNWTGFGRVSHTFLRWSDVWRRGSKGQYRFVAYIVTWMWT